MTPSRSMKDREGSTMWGPNLHGVKSASTANGMSVNRAHGATQQPTCQQQPQMTGSSIYSAFECAHYLNWIRVFLMLLVSFNHTMWLAGLGTSNSPAYGGVPTPQTGPATYIIARYLVGASLSYNMGVFFLRSGVADIAYISKMGPWQYLLSKSRSLLATSMTWELFLYPMLLCIGSGSDLHSVYQSYFSSYIGFGQLQMWRVAMVLPCTWLLVALYSLPRALTSMFNRIMYSYRCRNELLPTLHSECSSTASLWGEGSVSDLTICVAGSSVDLVAMVDKDVCKMPSDGFGKLAAPFMDSTASSTSSCCDSEATQPGTAPFTTGFMLIAAASLIIIQTGVMFGFAVTRGLTWNLHGVIVQYCFLGQYIISYCLGAYLGWYKALERLPARFGYWCLGLSIVVYTSAYVGTMFRPVAGHGSALMHIVDDWGSYKQQSVSRWSERLPNVSVQLSPHAPYTGLLLSTPSTAWLLFDCFITQTWAVMFTIGLLVFSRLHINIKPGKLGQMVIDAVYTFYILFPLVLVSLARAFAHVQLHPFAYVAVVWPLCFGVTYAVAIAIRSLPGASLFL